MGVGAARASKQEKARETKGKRGVSLKIVKVWGRVGTDLRLRKDSGTGPRAVQARKTQSCIYCLLELVTLPGIP